MSIGVSGRIRSGKSSLLEWLAWAFWKGLEFDVQSAEYGFEQRFTRWVIPKETVIVRDHGSWAWLALSDICKLMVHIPRGAIFEPDERQVKMENITFDYYDPTDLWHTLFDKLATPTAGDYIHVIEFDTFTEHHLILGAQFWRQFIKELSEWKQHHKALKFCFILDEFQMITKRRRAGTQQKELKIESEIITDTIVADFAKYWIRVVVSSNPFKAMDEDLRSQFAYYMLKHLTRTDLKGTPVEEVWRLTRNCAWNQVVVVHNGQPWGYNRFPFKLRVSNSHVHVHVKAPEEGLFLTEPLDSGEMKYARSVAHAIRFYELLHDEGVYVPRIREYVRFSWPDLEKMSGRGPKTLQMWITRWRPLCEDKGLLEPRKRKHEDEPEPLKPMTHTEEFLQESGQESEESSRMTPLSSPVQIAQTNSKSRKGKPLENEAFAEAAVAPEETT